MSSILQYLERNAAKDGTAFTYLQGKDVAEMLSFVQLENDAKTLATKLLSRVNPGDRLLLLMPDGLDYIRLFFACLYAGVIAVPMYPPRGERFSQRLAGVAKNSGASLAVVSSANQSLGIEGLQEISFAELQTTSCSGGPFPDVKAADIAFLQYTSGSTGDPKGVMITHRNIMANCQVIAEVSKTNAESVLCNWLPFYHDMGMVTTLLLAVYSGAHSVLLSQFAFIKNPSSWLSAATRYRATHIAAPNFAYDYCIDKVNNKKLSVLDLSSIRVAVNSAEPVSAQTLARFSEKFAACGFSADAFFPCYGMAEATVFISGPKASTPCSITSFDKQSLGSEQASLSRSELGDNESVDENALTRKLVSCGFAAPDHDIKIIHPDTDELLDDMRIGEVCFSGPSVAAGYWQLDASVNAATFGLVLGNEGSAESKSSNAYLRTGDLGFICDGELFICGRHKDLLIVRGRNYFPSDIERDGVNSYPDLRSAGAIVFQQGDNTLLLLEVERKAINGFDFAEAEQVVRAAVLEEHDLLLSKVLFVKAGSLPMTSSGKVRRSEAYQAYRDQRLSVIGKATGSGAHQAVLPSTDTEVQLAAIWTDLLEELLDTKPIGVRDSLFDLGVQSLTFSTLAARIEQSFQKKISLTDIFKHPTIFDLAKLLDSKPRLDQATLDCPCVSLHDSPDQPFPLTDVQQAYFIGRSSGQDISGVSTHGYYEVKRQNLDIQRYQSAWNILVDRHDMLRMRLTSDGQQRILAGVPEYEIKRYDFSATASDTEDRLAAHFAQIRTEMSHQVLALEKEPPFDIRVTLLPDNECVLHYSVDAIAMDASSALILEREIELLYADANLQLPLLDFSFRQYVLSQIETRQLDGQINTEANTEANTNTDYQQARDYWLSRLDQFPSKPDLTTAIDPSQISQAKFERRQQRIDASAWASLKSIAQNSKLTPTALIISCFAQVLNRWSQNSQFALNLTLFNRDAVHPDVNHVVGDFTTTDLLAIDAGHPNRSFLDQSAKIQAQLWSDLAHSAYNGIEFQRELHAQRKESLYPIVVTSTLGLEQDNTAAASIMSSANTAYAITQTPQVWLDMQIYEHNRQLFYNWDAVQGLFPQNMLDDMFAALAKLLADLAEKPEWGHKAQLPLLPEYQSRLVAEVNSTECALPSGLLHGPLLSQIKLSQIEQKPQKIAVKSPDKSLSYAELGERSKQLAQLLVASIEKDSASQAQSQLVAVVMKKGWEQVVAVLGILRAGFAYLPIDANLPPERIKLLLESGQVSGVLTTESYKTLIPDDYQIHTVSDEYPTNTSTGTADQLIDLATEDDLAYVIFTSGSTGAPKGVMIRHSAARNTIEDINQRFAVDESDSVFGLSSLSFDLSVYDIFGVLGSGGTLVLPGACELQDLSAWKRYLIDEKVTIWNTAPALMQLLLDKLAPEDRASLRLVLLSGDWIPLSLPPRLSEVLPQTQLVALGGATEASIWSNHFVVDTVESDWRSVPYGKPLANQQMYVLGEDLSPCPLWVVGDIYIAGAGLADGYWQDSHKTKQSFITRKGDNKRLYKTGDKGRLLPSGDIEFLGRADNQVKIQGHRIELGEIEASLKTHPTVEDAVVTLHNHKDRSHLIAYFTGTAATANNSRNQASSLEKQADGSIWQIDADKLEFQLSQKGVRRDLASTEISALNLVPEELSIFSICEMFRRESFAELALPKAYYPSAGSLYPVQIYITASASCQNRDKNQSQSEKTGSSMANGHYYYHPLENRLCLIQSLSEEESSISNADFSLHMVADLDAIDPIYGNGSEALCRLEAGYMIGLLRQLGIDQNAYEQINWSSATDNLCDGLVQDLALQKSHRPLVTLSFDLDRPDPKYTKDNLSLPKHISVASRKSYRHYLDSAPTCAQIIQLLSAVNDSQLQCYVQLRKPLSKSSQGSGEIALEEGVYRYDSADRELHQVNKTDPNSTTEAIYLLTTHNRALEAKASFSLFLVAEGREAMNDHLVEAGQLGQALYGESVQQSLGLCAIGVVDESACHNHFHLSSDQYVVHSFTGGTVSQQQIDALTDFPVSSLGEPGAAVHHIENSQLHEYLVTILPRHMVPSKFIKIDSLPLSTNGKVDRKQLPDPSLDFSEASYRAPQSATEKQVCSIIESQLAIDKVSMDSNLYDMGGDSVAAIRIMAAINEQLSIQTEISEIFHAQTIQDLCDAVETRVSSRDQYLQLSSGNEDTQEVDEFTI